MASPSPIGLIGGSGLGRALASEVRGERLDIDTPFGRPSGPIIRGQWEGAEIAFLARHGEGHVLNPSAVPYRANIYALKSLSVQTIIASGATGSLREEIRPRDLVVIDQVIDKTHRRIGTFDRANALIDRIGGFVGEHGNGTHDRQTRNVAEARYSKAGGLQQADG